MDDPGLHDDCSHLGFANRQAYKDVSITAAPLCSGPGYDQMDVLGVEHHQNFFYMLLSGASRYYYVRFPPTDNLDLPSVGEPVDVYGAPCHESWYLIIYGLDGALIWEGGDPTCELEWDVVPLRQRLGVGTRLESVPCVFRDDECAYPMEVVLRASPTDVGGQPLAFGEDREIVVGDRRYLARARYAFELSSFDWVSGECPEDESPEHSGRAFLARLERGAQLPRDPRDSWDEPDLGAEP